MTETDLLDLLRPHIPRILAAGAAQERERLRTATFSDVPDEDGGAVGFTAADLERFSDYYAADEQGQYPGHIHRAFGCGVKAFADATKLLRRGVMRDGKHAWVWVKRQTEKPAKCPECDGTGLVEDTSEGRGGTNFVSCPRGCAVPGTATFSDAPPVSPDDERKAAKRDARRLVSSVLRSVESEAVPPSRATETQMFSEYVQHTRRESKPQVFNISVPQPVINMAAAPAPVVNITSPPAPVVNVTSPTPPDTVVNVIEAPRVDRHNPQPPQHQPTRKTAKRQTDGTWVIDEVAL